ncbi:hypothetical protein [Halanaerobium sp. MA284_MarDTE_T2]|uniref:hypothetical protein n=1 Tax=Halanaerobium sp. MA284_MarDTE_T2 TaxID=2183913 RepID=UPI001F41BB91|nr:hypothetical protein [Halanaerobium sp. MA284_MarDTE_T2]
MSNKILQEAYSRCIQHQMRLLTGLSVDSYPKEQVSKASKEYWLKKIKKFVNTYSKKLFDYENSDELFREKLRISI